MALPRYLSMAEFKAETRVDKFKVKVRFSLGIGLGCLNDASSSQCLVLG